MQVAARQLLEGGVDIRTQIQERARRNLQALRQSARAYPACDVLKVDGGWSAIIRVPAVLTEEQLILELLNREGILVHPGYFFDFQREAFVVVSLLPPLDVFREAVPRLLRFASS